MTGSGATIESTATNELIAYVITNPGSPLAIVGGHCARLPLSVALS